MKIKIPMSEFVRAQLKGPTAVTLLLDKFGLDPFKRPIEYTVKDSENVVEVKQ